MMIYTIVTFYTIFLIAKLARLATLNSLSSLSRATFNSLSSLFHGSLILLSLTSQHSLCSLWLLDTAFLICTKIRHSYTQTHPQYFKRQAWRASHKQSQVPGITFFTVHSTPLGTSAIVEHWRESWALSQNLLIPRYCTPNIDEISVIICNNYIQNYCII